MKSIPFTVYDIFAYLFSGSIIIFTSYWGFNGNEVLKDEYTSYQIIAFIISSYILGHIISNLSAYILEGKIVFNILGNPSDIMMGGLKINKIKKWIFPGYYKELPVETRGRILSQARSRNFTGTGAALFLHMFSVVSLIEKLWNRLDEFRNLYGFARNMTLSLIISGIIILVSSVSHNNSNFYFLLS